ncbi:hypothetical protein D3C86_2167160 [compost metagenome]
MSASKGINTILEADNIHLNSNEFLLPLLFIELFRYKLCFSESIRCRYFMTCKDVFENLVSC